jgi:RND family efflux transporter MFP subunit
MMTIHQFVTTILDKDEFIAMFTCYRLPLIFAFFGFILSAFFAVTQAQENMVVEVINPLISTNPHKLKISGSLMAEKRSSLSPRVDGLIIKVNVDAGSQVKKGDVLLKLDPTMTQHQLKQVKANVIKAAADRDEAQRLVNEAQRLIARQHIPENELAMRKANLEIKKAEVLAIKASQATIEETLRRHELIAPFSGVISNKMSEAGEWVSRGDAVLELVNLDEIRLDINVPQERFSDIHEGALVTVISDAYPEELLKGQIQAIVPVSHAQVRAFLVRVAIDNKTLSLLPGTSATAEFDIKLADQSQLVIPRDALLNNPDGSHSIFIIEDEKALRRKVTLGRVVDDGVNIVDGLEADELVVVRGNEVLHDQQSVRTKQIRP